MNLRTSGIAAALVLATTAAHAQRVVRLPVQDRPLGGHITTVFGVGTMEGRSWEMLSNVEQAAFDRADNLYVLDRGNARVLVFDRGGRFVRQLGKKGGGPGELEVPVAFAVQPDGSVAVLDLAHQNITVYGADGAFRRTVPMQPEWGFPSRQMAADPRGGVVALLRPGLGMMSVQSLRNARSLPRSQVISRVSLAGEGSTTRLFEIPDNTVAQTRSSGPGQFDFRITGPPEFSPLTLWGVLPDGGVAVTHQQLYTIKVLDPNGRIVRWIQRPVRVRRPTERDRERARRQMRERMQSGRGMVVVMRGGPGGGGTPAVPTPRGPSPEQIEQRVREMQFADTVRTIQGMVVTPSGKLWIERTPANIGDPGPIDLVTPEGRYLGTLNGTKLPVAISATGRAAYLERDADDVERVIVRQLPAGWY